MKLSISAEDLNDSKHQEIFRVFIGRLLFGSNLSKKYHKHELYIYIFQDSIIGELYVCNVDMICHYQSFYSVKYNLNHIKAGESSQSVSYSH